MTAISEEEYYLGSFHNKEVLLPASLSEKLQLLRIAGSLFLSNALVFTIIELVPTSEARLVWFWSCGFVLIGVYALLVYFCARHYWKLYTSDRRTHTKHHNQSQHDQTSYHYAQPSSQMMYYPPYTGYYDKPQQHAYQYTQSPAYTQNDPQWRPINKISS